MNMLFRADNFSNVLSGLGVPSLDRTATTFLNPNNKFATGLARHWRNTASFYDIATLYQQSGIAAKIIDRPSDDCFQRGVTIEGDDDNLMQDEYDRLSVLAKMADAVRWSRLYGGSALLLVANDGGDFGVPLNLNAIDIIEEIKVLDPTCITRTDRYYTDITLSNYGQLEYYNISLPGMQQFEVHETRLIPMKGEPLPNTYFHQSVLPWMGRSILECCANSIARYDQALEWSLRLLERKQQAIYNMNGLGEMMANQDDALAARRLNMVDQVRSILNSIIVDKEDTYNILNLGLDGLEPLISEYQVAISADSNIPITILFGKSTTGLNNTGAGDLESYYGMVSHIQNIIASPVLEKLTSILWLQKSLTGPIPDDWEIVFDPLWVPTEQEQATTANLNAQANTGNVNTLIALMDNGILSPEEVRKIIVNKPEYAEYELPDTLPSTGGDMNYSDMVKLQSQVDALNQSGMPGAPQA